MTENIFKTKLPIQGESFDSLLEHKNIKIERIVSTEADPNKVYLQDQDEWVLLLKGKAQLDIDGSHIELEKGDYFFIPSGKKHRVLSHDSGTIWLAVHIS
jgi:cupin 2 domain-containing protein